jgi:hypothetical protein
MDRPDWLHGFVAPRDLSLTYLEDGMVRLGTAFPGSGFACRGGPASHEGNEEHPAARLRKRDHALKKRTPPPPASSGAGEGG